jgi:hypothetical protein
MNLGQVRDRFIALLNRDDLDTPQADEFLSLGLGRIQRELRAPLMERVHYVDVVGEYLETMQLPPDYLEGIDVLVNGTPLDRDSFRGLMKRATALGMQPAYYARYRNTLYLRGAVPPGMRVELLYYGEFTPLQTDADDNELTLSAPDLLIYAALSYAGDHFQHDSRAEWEARYVSLLAALREQARADEFSGNMAIQPAYYDPGF